MKFRPNPIVDTDSYKASHWKQVPKNTEEQFFYLESRGGEYNETVFFGLQYYLEEYLSQRITIEDVEEAQTFIQAHGLPFNYEGWKYVAEELHGLMPVEIKAVPEGSVVPTSNILMSVRTTDPKCPWIGSWLETQLMRIWYPITVATTSYQIKKTILHYLEETADDPQAEINFKLHDFGARGVSSRESAMIGGMAHLVNFMGSDTMIGVQAANHYYNHPMAGFSIPASEHSTITSWGQENEAAAYKNMLDTFAGKDKLVAVVSDSYDLENACLNIWGGELKEQVKNTGGTLVVRPDSGHPPTIVLQTVENLASKFGYTINGKGFKLLPPYIRVIQGDGIEHSSIREILATLTNAGWSASNVNFGMGGGLLQKLNRDTQRFAFKCSSITIDGKKRDVFKSPKTDPTKQSKRGELDLIYTSEGFKTVRIDEPLKDSSVLETVYKNGETLKRYNLDEIRERTNNTLS